METKIFNLTTLDSLKSCEGNYLIKEETSQEIKTDKKSQLTDANETKKKKFVILYENIDNEDINKISERKLLFLVHKRNHFDDNKEKECSKKTIFYRKHDRNEKDNIIKKIQIHYRNFLLSFTNDIIKKNNGRRIL